MDTSDDEDTLLRMIAAAPDVPVIVVAPGTIVQGRFRLDAPTGRGGMGVVWRATDLRLGRAIAIKLEHGAAADLTQLRQEARVLASLSHPNVVTVLGVGVHEDITFIAMELVAGGNARQWLNAQPRSKGEILTLYRQAGAGLAAAHGVGIVHRDFKPDNVLVGRDADGSLRARVADFGIARARLASIAPPELDTSSERIDDDATSDGALVGTPAYMAPEQVVHGDVDARADQYAFCVALHEALFGVRPGRPLRTRKHERAIRRVLERGLAQDPDDRFPSMQHLLARLERARRRRFTVLAVPMLGTLVLAWGLARADAPSCADAGTSSWTSARTEAIAMRLRDTELPGVDALASELRLRLDAQAAAFGSAWSQACERGDPVQRDASFACLRERREELGAVLDVLDAAQREDIRNVATIGDALADPARCLSDAAPLATPQAEAAREQLATARVEMLAGQYERARDRLAPILASAQELGDRVLMADALALRGRVHALRAEHVDAVADFAEAYTLALADKRDELALTSAAQAASANDAIGRGPEARTWIANARALAHDHTLSIAARAMALSVEAHLLSYTPDTARAVDVAREAVALFDDAPDDLHRADALVELSDALYRFGDFPAAIATARDALVIVERTLGPEHPRVAAILRSIGSYALHGHRRAESRASLTQALAILETWFGPADVLLVDVLRDLAHLDTLEDHHEDALVRLERARRIAIASGRPEVPTLSDLDDIIALALDGLDRHCEAVEVFRREIDAIERVRGPADPDLRFVFNSTAIAGQECGRTDDAEAWLRRAIAIDDALPDHDYLSGTLHNSLGFLLIELERFDDAEAELRRADALFDQFTAPGDPARAWPPFGLGRAARLRGDPDRAIPLLERALAGWDVGTRGEGNRELRRELAQALWASGRDRPRARALARELLAEAPRMEGLGEIVASR